MLQKSQLTCYYYWFINIIKAITKLNSIIITYFAFAITFTITITITTISKECCFLYSKQDYYRHQSQQPNSDSLQQKIDFTFRSTSNSTSIKFDLPRLFRKR